MISWNQSALVLGRRISDNILLAHEVVKDYHKPTGKPRCAIKIDLRKAFDSISWKFLHNGLMAMGFPPQFIAWLSECFSIPTYSIKINGQLEGYFEGHKGI